MASTRPILPQSHSLAAIDQPGNISQRAFDELQKVVLWAGEAPRPLQELLKVAIQSEGVTQAIMATAAIKALQRGCLLVHLKEAYKREPQPGMNWLEYFDSELSPIYKFKAKREQSYRKLWNDFQLLIDQGHEEALLLELGDNEEALRTGMEKLLEPTLTPKQRKTRNSNYRLTVKNGFKKHMDKVGVKSDEVRARVFRKIDELFEEVDGYIE